MRRVLRALALLPDFVRGQLMAGLRTNDSELAAELRRRLYNTCCRIDTGVVISNRRNFAAAEGSCLYHGTYVLNTGGRFEIGRESHLGAFCYVNARFGSVVLGDHVAVGPGTKIIAYSNHYARGAKVTEERQVADVGIGDNVFVGANCTILPGTRIGHNVVVAAGAVVRGDLESNAIYGGVPCRKLSGGWYE